MTRVDLPASCSVSPRYRILVPYRSQGCEKGNAMDDFSSATASRVDAVARLLDRTGLAESAASYAAGWGAVDREIRNVCTSRCPGHDSFQIVYPKVVIVDETYNAGLSRSVRAAAGVRFDAHESVAAWLCGQGRDSVEGAIRSQRTGRSTVDWLRQCIVQHGAVTEGLSRLGVTRSWPTSFVSKYLHFHNGDYPIYDSLADIRLRRVLAAAWNTPWVSCPALLPRRGAPLHASAYATYLSRFLYLIEASAIVRPGTTVKELDHYLWSRAAGSSTESDSSTG